MNDLKQLEMGVWYECKTTYSFYFKPEGTGINEDGYLCYVGTHFDRYDIEEDYELEVEYTIPHTDEEGREFKGLGIADKEELISDLSHLIKAVKQECISVVKRAEKYLEIEHLAIKN